MLCSTGCACAEVMYQMGRRATWLVVGFLGLFILGPGVALGEDCSNLEWSNKPGAYETQLMRRCNNPYFPASQQTVSKKDLEEARKIDDGDYILAKQRFAQLGQEIEGLPSTLTIADLNKIRERIEDFIQFAMGMGDQGYEIASKADELREALIEAMRAAFRNDEAALERIEAADTFHKRNVRKFYMPVLAQMLRERSPVRKEDTIATMLSATPDTIAVFMSLLPEDTQSLVRVEALKMMKEALDSGYVDNQLEEKIFALGSRNK